MSIENKQDAAEPTPASDGSVSVEPMAWWVDFGVSVVGHRTGYYTTEKPRAESWKHVGASVIPLYRRPQPTLTEEEREAIRFAAGEAAAIAEQNPTSKFWADHAACLRSAAERLG